MYCHPMGKSSRMVVLYRKPGNLLGPRGGGLHKVLPGLQARPKRDSVIRKVGKLRPEVFRSAPKYGPHTRTFREPIACRVLITFCATRHSFLLEIYCMNKCFCNLSGVAA